MQLETPEMFEKELLKVLQGEDLKTYGLKNNPFVLEKEGAPFLNRDDEQRILSRQIYRLSKGEIQLISVHGERGIGKTSFVFNLIPILEKLRDELGFNRIVTVEGLVDFDQKFVKSKALVEELMLKPHQRILFVVDDLDIIVNRYRENAIFFLEDIKHCIGIWTTVVLKEVSNLKDIKLPPSEELLLKPLSKDICKSIIISRIKGSLINKRQEEILFEDNVIDELVNLSEGNPQNLLSLCQQFFNFMVIRKARTGNINTFTKFREMSQLRSSEEISNVYKSLTDRQKSVFNLITKNIEMSYGEVATKMNLARSTVTEHLLALKDKGLLDVKMKRNMRVYYIPPEIAYTLEKITNNQT
mgnify:CR=1 FL=1